MIQKIIKEQLLLEKKIADIRANLTINYDLRHDERGQHSEKRKWRHVSAGGDRIYDLYIQQLVESAKDEITFHIVQEQIQDGVRFIVSQKAGPHLNVIIEPKMKNPYDWVLNVITVMNKQDFDIGRGQLQIFA
jgi:hypothetical protein